MAAVQEFNDFGVAATSVRLRIDDASALQLFAFRAFWIKKQNSIFFGLDMIEQPYTQYNK